MAAELTANSGDDASAVPDLLDQVKDPIRRFTADGAYDHRSILDRVGAAGTEDVVIVIPPRRSAAAGPPDGPWGTEMRRLRGFATSDGDTGRRSRATANRAGRERILPIQVGARRQPAGKEQQRSKERGHDRLSHPQPDG